MEPDFTHREHGSGRGEARGLPAAEEDRGGDHHGEPAQQRPGGKTGPPGRSPGVGPPESGTGFRPERYRSKNRFVRIGRPAAPAPRAPAAPAGGLEARRRPLPELAPP